MFALVYCTAISKSIQSKLTKYKRNHMRKTGLVPSL